MSKLNSTILKQLWEHLSQQSQRPDLLLENWVSEVAEWVRLHDYQEKLRQEESLWLPSSNKAELEVLLGLGALSTALNCSPVQLVRVLLEPLMPEAQIETEPLTQASAISPASSNSLMTEPTEMQILITFENSSEIPAETDASAAKAKPENYDLLLEALTDFQAVFELGVEQAGPQLDSQNFPAQELEAYLAELFDVVRAVLTQERIRYEQ